MNRTQSREMKNLQPWEPLKQKPHEHTTHVKEGL